MKNQIRAYSQTTPAYFQPRAGIKIPYTDIRVAINCVTITAPNKMGASVFFDPPVPIGKVGMFFGIPLDTGSDLFVVRCIPGDPESLDPMLATWPNVFEIIEEDLSENFGFTCPPDEMLEGTELTLNELFCMVDGFEDIGFTDSNGKFVVSTTIENALSLGASLYDDTDISKELEIRYGMFTVFSGLGFAVNQALDSVVTNSMVNNMLSQKWDIHKATISDTSAPVWQLLYDEQASTIVLDETDKVTMILTLGHADTARILAKRGSNAARGTQYFWLSKDCYDFFPPLTIPNSRGRKKTYSCKISMNFIDLDFESDCRVTFEAENNLDFRLGTGPLRYTKKAELNDMAAITRLGEYKYELRIYKQGTSVYDSLSSYAINFIGHQGKRYGFISNQEYLDVITASISPNLQS